MSIIRQRAPQSLNAADEDAIDSARSTRDVCTLDAPVFDWREGQASARGLLVVQIEETPADVQLHSTPLFTSYRKRIPLGQIPPYFDGPGRYPTPSST